MNKKESVPVGKDECPYCHEWIGYCKGECAMKPKTDKCKCEDKNTDYHLLHCCNPAKTDKVFGHKFTAEELKQMGGVAKTTQMREDYNFLYELAKDRLPPTYKKLK